MSRKSLQGSGTTPQRTFRLPDDEWDTFLARTEAAGTTAAATIQNLIRWYNRAEGAKLPPRPPAPAKDAA